MMKRTLICFGLALCVLEAQKKPFWSLRPVEKPAGEHSIDAFLEAKLKAKGLGFNPRADARTLVRRLHFDLTGLPPAPEAMARSYEETVEALLGSPAYGERWGRHWLDVVRFGETDGGEHNYERPHAWRYRDYVIDAFNSDKPYPQFLREQIAGDLLAPEDPRMVAATGFLVAGPWDQVQAEINKDKVMAMTQRADELDDMVTTTFHTFQGLTVNCARCHDHKFDPIPAKDYYRLTAVFAGVGFGNRPVGAAAAIAEYNAKLAPLKKEWDAARAALFALEEPVRAKLLEPRYRALAEERKHEAQRLPLNNYYNRNDFAATKAAEFRMQFQKAAKLTWLEWGGARRTAWEGTSLPLAGGEYARIEFASPSRPVYELQASDDGKQWRTIASSLDHIGQNEFDLPKVAEAELDQHIDRKAALARKAAAEAALAALPAPAQVYAAKPKAAVEKVFLLERGSVAKPLEEVSPGGLSAIPALPADLTDAAADDRARRLALANWLTDAKNPLTARVIVNRVWFYHFGNGLVNTPSDFGVMGDRPSHPELLDWLAAEFVENGWSLKWLHRKILASRAYQQSSALNEAAMKVDAANRLLWRMAPKRIDAEALRDGILFASGKLVAEPRGGPSFVLQKKDDRGAFIYKALDNDGPAVWRRAVYRFVVRGGERIMLDSFDCPDPAVATPQRAISNTPVQALTLMNNEFVVKQAGFLAERARDIDGLYRILFQRAPSAKERDLATAFGKRESLAALARVLINSNEFSYVD
jgi:hypothetical protein